ncbi:MAG: TetR/AcrR family transcriptional regulator [Myxococcota bacterium]|nr:TetR/AcrR family transcriptional regulator [Myxococcota bacterium]
MAAAILLEDGPAALTMERLAERAGVSKGLGYVYFRDAEDVALSLWDREVSDVYRRVEEATADAGSFEAGLRRAVRAYFDVVAERGALLGRLQAHFGGARTGRRSARRVRAFLEFWSRRIREGLGAPPRTAGTLAAMMLNAADAASRAWTAGVVGREEAERLCMAFVTAGLPAALEGGAAPEPPVSATRRGGA